MERCKDKRMFSFSSQVRSSLGRPEGGGEGGGPILTFYSHPCENCLFALLVFAMFARAYSKTNTEARLCKHTNNKLLLCPVRAEINECAFTTLCHSKTESLETRQIN